LQLPDDLIKKPGRKLIEDEEDSDESKKSTENSENIVTDRDPILETSDMDDIDDDDDIKKRALKYKLDLDLLQTLLIFSYDREIDYFYWYFNSFCVVHQILAVYIDVQEPTFLTRRTL
jgi:hypothetical protein